MEIVLAISPHQQIYWMNATVCYPSLAKSVGGQSLINSDGTATQLVAGQPSVERAIANKVTINADKQHIALTFNLQNGPTKGVLISVQSLDGGQAGALLQLSNNFVLPCKSD
jgi:hypothetical protein